MSTVGINLEKGGRLDLTKGNPGLVRINLGLGWDVNTGSGGDFDLDAFAFTLKGGKLHSGNTSVVFFNNTSSPGVAHSGDNLTGAGDGDDETIAVDLLNLPADADEVLFGVNIYKAGEHRQNFGQVSSAFIRAYNSDTKDEILKHDLNEDSSSFTGYILGKIYKKDGEWKFQAIDQGINGSIAEIAQPYF